MIDEQEARLISIRAWCNDVHRAKVKSEAMSKEEYQAETDCSFLLEIIDKRERDSKKVRADARGWMHALELLVEDIVGHDPEAFMELFGHYVNKALAERDKEHGRTP